MKFNYEDKTWGETKLLLKPTYLGYLRLKYALQAISKTEGELLEVGCGGGGIIKTIKQYRPSLNCYGIDISRKAIKKAKINNNGVHFSYGNACNLQFDNGKFDAVLMFDLLEHLTIPQLAIKEAARVLKKGGVFFCLCSMRR